MNEIVIPKRVLVIAMVFVVLAAVVVWAFPMLRGNFQAQAQSPTTQPPEEIQSSSSEDELAKEAALAGAQAFYTVDNQAGQQKWLDQLCKSSTQTGCVVYQNVIVPNLWTKLEQAKTVTTVKASAQEKVQEQVARSRDNAPMQVWRLQIQLSAPWPVQKEPVTEFPAFALVIKENGAWKFERFLTEEELQAIPAQEGQQ